MDLSWHRIPIGSINSHLPRRICCQWAVVNLSSLEGQHSVADGLGEGRVMSVKARKSLVEFLLLLCVWFYIMWILRNSCLLMRERMCVWESGLFFKRIGWVSRWPALAPRWSFLLLLGNWRSLIPAHLSVSAPVHFPVTPMGERQAKLRIPSSSLTLEDHSEYRAFHDILAACFQTLLSSFYSYHIFSE